MDKEFVFTIIREVFGQSREGTSTQFTNGSPCDVIKSGQQPDAPTTELATVVAQPKEVPLASRQSQIDDTVMKSIVWWNSRVSAYSDSESLQKSSDCDSAYSCCSSYADAEKQVDPSDLAQRAHQVEWWNGQLRSVRDDVDDDACSVSLPLTQDSSTHSEEDAASTSSSSQSDADIDLPTTFPREDIQSEIITAPTTVISSEGASEPSFPMTRRDIPAAPRRTILDAAELSFD